MTPRSRLKYLLTNPFSLNLSPTDYICNSDCKKTTTYSQERPSITTSFSCYPLVAYRQLLDFKRILTSNKNLQSHPVLFPAIFQMPALLTYQG